MLSFQNPPPDIKILYRTGRLTVKMVSRSFAFRGEVQNLKRTIYIGIPHLFLHYRFGSSEAL